MYVRIGMGPHLLIAGNLKLLLAPANEFLTPTEVNGCKNVPQPELPAATGAPTVSVSARGPSQRVFLNTRQVDGTLTRTPVQHGHILNTAHLNSSLL